MSGHRIHLSTTERGWAASCSCGWRVVRVAREERAEAVREHRDTYAPLDVPPGRRYVCREHPHHSVTPRGTGCPDCSVEDVRRLPTTRSRRKALEHEIREAGSR